MHISTVFDILLSTAIFIAEPHCVGDVVVMLIARTV